jgi:two-component system sensor histidine kinase/response regulator
MEIRGRVLLIDDEEVVLDSCSQILMGTGCEIATASNGQRGLDLLRSFKPDLVFVDLKMPGLSGFEVIKQINEVDPTIVPIVITGFATVSSAVEAMKNGAYDFLPKPFTPDEFRLIARRGMDRRNLLLETIALRKEKEMLRENFAAIVSHELKAPLGTVQQNLFLLSDQLKERLTADEKRRLERMQTNLSDLNKLILTWLRVLSVDVTKIQENFGLVSLGTVVHKAVEGVGREAEKKAIGITVSGTEPDMQVNGDEGTLVETLVNILGNAIKYSRPDGEVRVGIEQSGSNAVVSVTDFGVGIAADDLPYIFNDFYSGRPAESGQKGTGIGLTVAKRIIEAHSGSIKVQSEPGTGTTFSIQLPLLKVAEPAGET